MIRMTMKSLIPFIAGLFATLGLDAQDVFVSPADTVYLQMGPVATVHIKGIDKTVRDALSPYRIRTHESLGVEDRNVWSNISGGWRWTGEQLADGIKSLYVKKVVFADGFVLPFEGGEFDRALLLTAPSYKGAHGDFLAEGVVALTRDEMRQLIGEETWLLGYRVRKNQARAGLAKVLVGAPAGFLGYLTRGNAVQRKKIATLVDGHMEYDGPGGYQYNPLWHTGTAFAAATAAYGVVEMAAANISINHLASDFRTFEAPSERAFRNKALLGGGLLLAGGVVTGLGYVRIAKDPGWSETYGTQTVMGVEVQTVHSEGKKMALPWLLPAAGALIANFGLTELTRGFTGLSGYAKLRAAGLARAEVHLTPMPCGLGISMVF